MLCRVGCDREHGEGDRGGGEEPEVGQGGSGGGRQADLSSQPVDGRAPRQSGNHFLRRRIPQRKNCNFIIVINFFEVLSKKYTWGLLRPIIRYTIWSLATM